MGNIDDDLDLSPLFSGAGCVVDPYGSRLDTEMAEALICTKDWVAAARKGAYKLQVLPVKLANFVPRKQEKVNQERSRKELLWCCGFLQFLPEAAIALDVSLKKLQMMDQMQSFLKMKLVLIPFT